MQTQAPDHRGLAAGTVQQRFSSRPDGQSVRPGQTGRELTTLGILTAFRRRWVPALALAIPAALLAAAVVWEVVPAKYESYAMLKIQQYEQVLSFDTKERHTEFLTYRDTQKGFLRSRGVLTAALRNPEVADCRTLRSVEHPVDWLMKQIIVDEEISPEFLRIGLAGEYPKDLAMIVNAVKDSYLNEVVYNERNEKIERLRQLEESFNEVDKRVRTAHTNIDKLAENLGTGDSKVAILNQGLIQQKLMDLQKELRDINSRIRAEEAARQSLRENGISSNQLNADGLMGITSGGSSAGGTGFGDDILGGGIPSGGAAFGGGLQRELLSVRQRIAQFQSQLRNPNHPDLLELRRQEQQLVELMGGSGPAEGATATDTPKPGARLSRIDWLKKQQQALNLELEQQNSLLKDTGARIVELERERREIEQDIKTRDALRQQLAERRVELNAPERISVVQDAHIPEQREIKKKTQLSMLAALATFGAIVCGFTLFEWFSHRIGAATDVSGEVGLRLVGTIPSPEKGGLLGLGILAGRVDYEEWNRAVTESMDFVRTFLMRHIDPSRSASILITSASANEGKTTVSCQLAASLARTGKRVALVDCDFRRPSAHLMMDAKQGPGLSEYLRGECTLDQIRQQTLAPGLHFIGAGQVDQRVLQLLSVDGGRTLIHQLKQVFDFVIIDTSPLLFVAEPSMIAQNADIVIMATRRDYSRVPYVVQARDSLRSLQVPLLGAIMVGADSDFQRQIYGYQQELPALSRR
ncbi:MAG: tyrosine-protein kinase family protein [Planctomyces sp.]|jgi:succinoglycan biosynthesis transport protein ExoP